MEALFSLQLNSIVLAKGLTICPSETRASSAAMAAAAAALQSGGKPFLTARSNSQNVSFAFNGEEELIAPDTKNGYFARLNAAKAPNIPYIAIHITHHKSFESYQIRH